MVSIILITYNRAERLKLSIQDILDQTFKDFELIICDDHSTDNTQQVCNEFAAKDSRIKYIRHEQNKGMPGNLNYGFKMAQQEYIGILHDGDRFAPTLIQQWYDGMNSDPSIGFVYNAIGVTDANDKLKHAYQEFETGLVDRKYLLHKVFFRRWKFDSPVWGEGFVRKSLLEDYGYFHDEYRFFADVDFWLHMLHTHNAYYIKDILMTGPDKDVQPRLFGDKLIYTYLYMFTMHKRHRYIEFKKNAPRLIKEMAIFYLYAHASLAYNLVLTLKHNNYQEYMHTGKSILNKSFGLYINWVVLLIFSPFIKLLTNKN